MSIMEYEYQGHTIRTEGTPERWSLYVDGQFVNEYTPDNPEDAEIERLKALITELADALNHPNFPLFSDLRRRAREATK